MRPAIMGEYGGENDAGQPNARQQDIILGKRLRI
jgi:hypothetical protein